MHKTFAVLLVDRGIRKPSPQTQLLQHLARGPWTGGPLRQTPRPDSVRLASTGGLQSPERRTT
jgi:hypothetical protein